MCLDQDKDYYVKPVKDDPPDVELLVFDRDSFVFTVVRLENGEQTPRYVTLEAIAGSLGRAVQDLVSGDELVQ